MSNQLDEVKTIYLNTPKQLNLPLLFNEYKAVFIPKIQFLIHQINFNHSNGGYQINIKNHSWLLGIKDGELSSILSKLVDNDIIKKTRKHQQGKNSNTYAMVTPFNFKDKNNVAVNSYEVKQYLFLKKWVLDGNVVKSKDDSAFQKTSSINFNLDLRIKELEASCISKDNRIRELEALLKVQGLQIAVPVPEVNLNAAHSCISPDETPAEPKALELE